MMPMMLVATQYIARPLGKLNVRKPNIRGIMVCIMVFIWLWLGSNEGMVIIFCCTHIEPATSTGRT